MTHATATRLDSVVGVSFSAHDIKSRQGIVPSQRDTDSSFHETVEFKCRMSSPRRLPYVNRHL